MTGWPTRPGAQAMALLGGILLLLSACRPAAAPPDLPTRAVLLTFTASPSPSPSTTRSPTATITPSATASPSPSVTASRTPSPTASPSLVPTLIQGEVTSDVGAYVRRGPGIAYEIVGEIAAGQRFSILAYLDGNTGETWYLIRLADGGQAWISDQVAALVQAEKNQIALAITQPATSTPVLPTLTLPTQVPTLPPGANARVTGDLGVNLRAGPSYNDDILRVIEKEAALTLIGRNQAATWYEAVTAGAIGLVGWVNADFVTPLTDPQGLAVTWVGPVTAARVACGVNIHPKDGQGGLPIPADLLQTAWVRFPFTASPRHFPSLEAAFAYFDPIISAYYAAGVKVILVLTHETYGELAGWDWLTMDSEKWRQFSANYAAVAEQVAQHYGAQVAAYEVWNEGDTQRGDEAGVAIPPEDYANLLRQTSSALRRVAPNSKIVVGGLLDASGFYLRAVKKALGGNLPVDAIALHPYGRGAPNAPSAFAQFGGLDSVIEAYAGLAPNLPLWITEIGALGAYRPNEAASYWAALYQYLSSTYADRVEVILWYGWSDTMHLSRTPNGLVNAAGLPSNPLYQAFFRDCAD